MRKRRGFTLIELLVVVVIIGILASVATAAFRDAQDRSRNSGEISLIRAVQMGMEQWKTDYTGLPEELVGPSDPSKYLCSDSASGSTAWPVKYTPGAMLPKTPWATTPQDKMFEEPFINMMGKIDAMPGKIGAIFDGSPIDNIKDKGGYWDDGGAVHNSLPPAPGQGPNSRYTFGYMYIETDPSSGRYLVTGVGKYHNEGVLVGIKANF